MQANTTDMHEEQITLKEIILKSQEYFRELLKYWWFIILICLLTTSYFMYKHYKHVPTYTAELRFVVEGQGRGGGGLSSLLGSFGIKRGGKVNPYKILEVGKSSKLFEEIAFSKFNSDSTIADKILSEYNLVSKWSKNSDQYKNFHFVNDSIKSPIEKKVFKKLKSVVWGLSGNSPLLTFYLNEEQGIYSIRTSTTDEALSILISNKFYQSIKQFFEDEVFENQKRSAEILAFKTDSINAIRKSKIYQLARFEDRNHGILNRENLSQKTILNQDIQTLTIAYSELVKNYEMTDVNLKDLQPLFMEIDRPFSPIDPEHRPFLKNIILGMIIGIVIGALMVIIRKLYNEIMNVG